MQLRSWIVRDMVLVVFGLVGRCFNACLWVLLNKIETNKIEFVTMALDVDSLPKVEEIHERVRKRYDGLFHQKEDGTR